MADQAGLTATALLAVQRCRQRRLEQNRQGCAPAAMGKFAPARLATPPAARHRLLRDARICGGKVSCQSFRRTRTADRKQRTPRPRTLEEQCRLLAQS